MQFKTNCWEGSLSRPLQEGGGGSYLVRGIVVKRFSDRILVVVMIKGQYAVYCNITLFMYDK